MAKSSAGNTAVTIGGILVVGYLGIKYLPALLRGSQVQAATRAGGAAGGYLPGQLPQDNSLLQQILKSLNALASKKTPSSSQGANPLTAAMRAAQAGNLSFAQQLATGNYGDLQRGATLAGIYNLNSGLTWGAESRTGFADSNIGDLALTLPSEIPYLDANQQLTNLPDTSATDWFGAGQIQQDFGGGDTLPNLSDIFGTSSSKFSLYEPDLNYGGYGTQDWGPLIDSNMSYDPGGYDFGGGGGGGGGEPDNMFEGINDLGTYNTA